MTTIDVTFSPKRPEDIERFAINFATVVPAGDTIKAAVVDVVVLKGPTRSTDPMIQGQPNIDGTIVSQLVGGGSPDSTYGIRFAIDTTAGLHFEIVGSLQVRD